MWILNIQFYYNNFVAIALSDLTIKLKKILEKIISKPDYILFKNILRVKAIYWMWRKACLG